MSDYTYMKHYCTPEGSYGECSTVEDFCCSEYRYRMGHCSYDTDDACCTDYQLSLANSEIETNYTWCYHPADYANDYTSGYQCEKRTLNNAVHCLSGYSYACFPDEIYCDPDCEHWPGQCDNGTYVCDTITQCPSPPVQTWIDEYSENYHYQWWWSAITWSCILVCCIIVVVILQRRYKVKQKRNFPMPMEMEQSLNNMKQEQECENDINIIGVVHSVSIIYEDKGSGNCAEYNDNQNVIDNEGVEGA